MRIPFSDCGSARTWRVGAIAGALKLSRNETPVGVPQGPLQCCESYPRLGTSLSVPLVCRPNGTPSPSGVRYAEVGKNTQFLSYLVDPGSSHMLVSKTKPCMAKYKHFYTRETANGSLNQL